MLKKHSIANGEERASLGTIGSIVCSKTAWGALIAKRLRRNIFWQWDVQSDYVSFLLSSVYQDLHDWSSHDFWCADCHVCCSAVVVVVCSFSLCVCGFVWVYKNMCVCMYISICDMLFQHSVKPYSRV